MLSPRGDFPDIKATYAVSSLDDMERVADLVRLCAATMRKISKGQNADLRHCPFKHVARNLDNLSDEIKLIAEGLPDRWRRGLH